MNHSLMLLAVALDPALAAEPPNLEERALVAAPGKGEERVAGLAPHPAARAWLHGEPSELEEQTGEGYMVKTLTWQP